MEEQNVEVVPVDVVAADDNRPKPASLTGDLLMRGRSRARDLVKPPRNSNLRPAVAPKPREAPYSQLRIRASGARRNSPLDTAAPRKSRSVCATRDRVRSPLLMPPGALQNDVSPRSTADEVH